MSMAREGPQDPVPRMVCRTKALADTSEVDSCIGAADIVWISPGTTLVGIGTGYRCRVPRTPRRFAEVSASLRTLYAQAHVEDDVDLPGSGPIAFGSFSFDWKDRGSDLILPSVVYGMTDSVAWKTELFCDPPLREAAPRSAAEDRATGNLTGEQLLPRRGESAGRESDLPEWKEIFEKVRGLLEEGDLKKVVLARKVILDLVAPLDRGFLLSCLAREFPGCFTFRFGNFVGASPELLLRKLGPVVDSMPIAGSSPRSSDEAEDERLGRALMASAKDQAEHELTKRAVVFALDPFCSTLEAEAEPSLLLLSNVQHLSSKVQGRLKGEPDCLQLVGALHPTPAVCGVPTGRALEAIRTIEGFSRGRYAGPIGWMDRHGDGEWAIALRCAELDGSSAVLFAGAGILTESTAESEYMETELKLQAMRSALRQS